MGNFAIAVFPREAAELARGSGLAGRLPARLAEKLFSLAPPMKVSDIPVVRSDYGSARGWFVSVPLDPRRFPDPPERLFSRAAGRAGRLAERLGAVVLGLGGPAQPGVAAGGAFFPARKGPGLTVTGGQAYTLAAALEGCKKAALLAGHSLKNLRAAVIGAAGPAGRVCALKLAGDVGRMVLAGGEKRKLEELAGKLYYHFGLSAGIAQDAGGSLRGVGLLVVANGGSEAAIRPGDLAPGAVVCNLAEIPGLSERLAGLREDLLVLEGGVIAVPGNINFRFTPGLPPGTSLPATAEAMILAMEGKSGGFSPGTISAGVDIISALAARHGFKLAGFKSGGRFLSPGEIGPARPDPVSRLPKRGINCSK